MSSQKVLESRPGFLIRRLHQIHIHLFYEETQAFNISPVQYSLLSVLQQDGEMDQNTLARELGLERTSVAEVIPRLVDRGLILRRPSEKDKRYKLVSLTDEGASLVADMLDAVQRAHDRTVEALTPGERTLLTEMLLKLIEDKNDKISVPMNKLK